MHDLRQEGEAISLHIQDNGRGFDLRTLSGVEGIGLAGMRERVEKLNGSLSIDSNIAGGTTISVHVPLNK